MGRLVCGSQLLSEGVDTELRDSPANAAQVVHDRSVAGLHDAAGPASKTPGLT